MASKTIYGIISSISAKSLENLFNMLPTKCVSKNIILAFNIFSNMILCNLTDALLLKRKYAKALPKVNTVATPTIIE